MMTEKESEHHSCLSHLVVMETRRGQANTLLSCFLKAGWWRSGLEGVVKSGRGGRPPLSLHLLGPPTAASL